MASSDCEIFHSAFSRLTLCCTPVSSGSTATNLPILILCDSNGNILSIKINLSLDGTIAEALGSLASLETLDLSGNNLVGEIPPSLGNLTKLTRLDLSDNKLVGPVPQSLTRLTNLEFLHVENNLLNGTVPAQLTQTSIIPHSNFNNNCFPDLPHQNPACVLSKLSNPLPLVNNDCANLATAMDKLSFYLPVPATNCCTWNPRLIACDTSGFVTTLAFGSSGVSGQLPDELFLLSQLSTLQLNSNALVSQIPTSIGNATNLRIVDLSFNQLNGVIPNEVGNLVGLEQLRLSSNSLTGPIPSSLGTLTQLSDLNLQNNHLTGTVPLNLGIFITEFDHNCLSGTTLPNQSDCIETPLQRIGKIVGGVVAGLVFLIIVVVYVVKTYKRVKEAQRSMDTLEFASTEKLASEGEDLVIGAGGGGWKAQVEVKTR
ncbi:hypothetical protein HDU98_002458 [Podochytrium sp. JEL0797]|nr:hypothetical protein HDU98_002458 [Podochytrium sp. JEL0797]